MKGKRTDETSEWERAREREREREINRGRRQIHCNATNGFLRYQSVYSFR